MKSNNSVIVVLGPGRSGTSMVMNILVKLGMQVSEKLFPAAKGNPRGYFEDIEIMNIQKQLLLELNAQPNIPLPKGWQEAHGLNSFINALSEIVQKNVQASKNIWGFKDPRTTVLLDLWTKVFDNSKVEPKYILAVRNPASVAVSLKKSARMPEELSELMWLYRICEGLLDTDFKCFVVHYEEALSAPCELGRKIAEYTGLHESVSGEEQYETLKEIVSAKLNRSQDTDYELKNPYVKKVYEKLVKISGVPGSDSELRSIIEEAAAVYSAFVPWAEEANKNYANALAGQNKLAAMETSLQNMVTDKVGLQKTIAELQTKLPQEAEKHTPLSISEDVKVELAQMASRANELMQENLQLKKQINENKVDFTSHAQLLKENALKNQQLELLIKEREVLAHQIARLKSKPGKNDLSAD